MGRSLSWEADSTPSYANPPPFVEFEVSFKCSQEPAGGQYPEPAKFNPQPPTLVFLIFILILSSHLRLYLPSGLFPSGFLTTILYAVFVLPYALYASPGNLSWFCDPNNIWRRVQIMQLRIMAFSSCLCHFVPVACSYSSAHPVLRHCQSVFFF
jgi:hypothetical protein